MRGLRIMIQEGSSVSGRDVYGNNVNGTVSSILRTFGVALVKTGDDRTKMTSCHIADLNVQK
jgi:hypothetical protein